MLSNKHIHKNLIESLAEQVSPEIKNRPNPYGIERNPERLKQFFKTAEHRKRQILERMLLD